jgi:heat shock protein HslJ
MIIIKYIKVGLIALLLCNTVTTIEASELFDFKATGNEPFWSLEINFDGVMYFKSLNLEQEFKAPVPKPDFAQDHQAERYRAITDQGEMIVVISPDSCMDTMSDENFPFRVTVSIKLSSESDYKEFNGCGRYLLNSRLHNIWVLEEIEGEPVASENFNRGLPTLEIYAAQGRLAGHDGCNQLFGKVTGSGDQLTFGALGATMMYCSEMEKSNQFLRLISGKSFEYRFESRQLFLSQDGKVMLRFKHID